MLTMQSCVAAMLDAGTAQGASIVTSLDRGKHPDAGRCRMACRRRACGTDEEGGTRARAEGFGSTPSAGVHDTHMTAIIDVMPDERKVQFYGSTDGRKGVPREIAKRRCSSPAMSRVTSRVRSFIRRRLLHRMNQRSSRKPGSGRVTGEDAAPSDRAPSAR